MKKSLSLLMIAAFVATGHSAAAQTQIVTPSGMTPVGQVVGAPGTVANVVLAAIKQGVLDMSSDAAIDDFAKIEYCDIYKRYRPNEFDWRNVRAAMRKKIELDKPTYPDTLYLERVEKMGQYDFAAGMLLVLPESVLHTRALQLTATLNQHFCGETLTKFPDKFIAILDKPLDFDGIELTEDQARAVISGLQTEQNDNARLAYGRYTITFTNNSPPQTESGPIQLNAKLDDITLYQDTDYSRPFWSGESSLKSYGKKNGSGALDVIPFKGIDPTQQKLDTSKPVPTVTPAPVQP